MPALNSSGGRRDSARLQIARSIRNQIEAGVLRDGEVLPSTRELATTWNVSVFTISEAMKQLESEGLVTSKSRSMRIVNAPASERQAPTRLRQPHVFLIGGYAGSGKTELGRILARETGWPIIDKDTITRPVVEVALEILGQPSNDRESETYLSVVRPREYEAVIATTIENIECGTSAVVTAPFVKEFSDPAWIERTLASLEVATVTLVWVACDAETMHRYLRHRGAARDAYKLANWLDYLKMIDVAFRPAAAHHVVDNSSSSPPLQSQARELLQAAISSQAT